MNRSFRAGLLLSVACSLLLVGCVLVFNPPYGQHFEVAFRLAESLASGERHAVATWELNDPIDTRKKMLQLSGGFERLSGNRLPREVKVSVTVLEPPTDRARKFLKLTAAISPEDRFRVSKKISRNLAAGSRVEIQIEPVGNDLPAGTGVRLCVDVVESKGDLREFASCAAGGGPATFAAIQEQILTPACATGGCHDAATAAAGLNLENGQAYTNLVDVPSSQIFLRLRVDPGKPDDSYLIQKVRGSSSINGGRMPLGGPFLSADEIAGIVEWIANGARSDP